jgi:hypothetical protein
MTHCERILDYMHKNGSITQKEADRAFGCTRLSGRIYDLKKRGYEFGKIIETGVNRFGEPEHHARYFITKEPAA